VRETPVAEIMASPMIVVTPETSVDECMSIMTDHRIRHVPVVDDGEIVAVVPIGDTSSSWSPRAATAGS
jgi:CBS domain-containing protein